jgi:hypothetical protein
MRVDEVILENSWKTPWPTQLARAFLLEIDMDSQPSRRMAAGRCMAGRTVVDNISTWASLCERWDRTLRSLFLCRGKICNITFLFRLTSEIMNKELILDYSNNPSLAWISILKVLYKLTLFVFWKNAFSSVSLIWHINQIKLNSLTLLLLLTYS